MENTHVRDAVAELNLPPIVKIVVADDDSVVVRVAGEPFGYPEGAYAFSDPVWYRAQATAPEIGHAILTVAQDLIAAAFQANVRYGAQTWSGPTDSKRAITVNPAPVTLAPPIVNVTVTPPAFDPVVNVAAPQVNMPEIKMPDIRLPEPRRIRRKVIRDKNGLMLGVEDIPDAI